MTIRVVDTASAAVAADAQLASAVLQWPAETALAAQADCTRGAAASWDYRYPPRLHSVPAGNDDTFNPAAELGWMLLLWRPASRATSITVRVRCTTVVGPVRLALHVARFDDLLRSSRIGASATTYDTSVGEETATLSASGLSLEPGALYAVCVSARSSTGDVEGLYCNAHSPHTSLSGWIAPAILADTSSGAGHDNFWSPDGVAFTAVAEDDAPYLVEIVSGSDPLSAAYDATKAGGPLPAGRLLWRIGRSVSNLGTPAGLSGTVWDALWVWPPIEAQLSSVALGSGDWIRRTQLAYVDVHGVELVEGVEALPGFGSLLAPERRATSAAGQASAGYAEHALGQHARAYAVAPSCDYPAAQADASLLGGFDHHAGVRANVDGTWTLGLDDQLLYDGTWVTVAEGVVGHPDLWSRDGGSTVRARAIYRVTLLLAVLVDSPGAAIGELEVELRARITDLAGSTAGAYAAQTAVVRSSPYTQLHDPAVFAAAGQLPHWIGFQGSSSNRTPQRHSLRGNWCNTAWRDAARRYTVVELVVADDGDPAGLDRVLTVEARAGAEPSFGTRQAFFLLDGLHVEAVRGYADAAGVEV